MLDWIRARLRARALPRVDGPVALPAGQAHRLQLGAGERLSVRQGRLWLTREGDPRDHLLTPGTGYVAACPQEVVLESLLGSDGCYERDTLSHAVTPTSLRCRLSLATARSIVRSSMRSIAR